MKVSRTQLSMKTKLSAETLARTCCPACRSKLEQTASAFTCVNPACHARFPVVDGVPILIDEASSLFSLDAYEERSDVYLHKHGRVITWLADRLPRIGQNLKAADNYKRFAKLLNTQDDGTPKVLVIGGGVQGVGMESLVTTNVQLINSDVALTPVTEIVLDAHSIPFEDETFDGVVAQAVLEHVLNPGQCVAEFHRVLKPGGLVYAEIPFMQQVHGREYDFTRFSHLGMLHLFQRFGEVDSSPCCGPGMALAWSIQYFFLSFTTHLTLRRIIKALSFLTLFPLKYLDLFLIERPGAFDAASAYFYIGRKTNDEHRSEKEILASYRGAMQAGEGDSGKLPRSHAGWGMLFRWVQSLVQSFIRPQAARDLSRRHMGCQLSSQPVRARFCCATGDSMKVERLIYIANARLPTEKAHGLQIVKMCEAFVQNGLKVTLMHPYRQQSNPQLKGQSLFDYYSLSSLFRVRSLPNFDIVPLQHLFPKRAFPAAFFVHGFVWGAYAALVARRQSADFYFTRDSFVAYWLIKLGLPTVYEAHLVPNRAQRWLLRWMANQPALKVVVTLNSFIKRWFVETGVPMEKVIVLPHGVELSLFESLPPRDECRRQLGLPLEDLIIGYIGRFHTLGLEKGIPELVQAMASIPPLNGKEPILLCVGGPMEAVPAYLEVARRHGVPEHRLRFVDHVPNREVPLWIGALDLAVAPYPNTEYYRYFITPLKLFEYMAAGVPIVASDLPSIREVLRDVENTWLVEPADPRELAEGIGQGLRNNTLSRGIGCRAQRAATEYTWEGRASCILNHVQPTL